MEEFRFKVTMDVTVRAFEWRDALELLEDYFAGSLGEFSITSTKIEHK